MRGGAVAAYLVTGDDDTVPANLDFIVLSTRLRRRAELASNGEGLALIEKTSARQRTA